jgi:hypothetical protein
MGYTLGRRMVLVDVFSNEMEEEKIEYDQKCPRGTQAVIVC